MSRKDQKEWEAMLAADPGLNAAWNGFRDMLGRMTSKDPLTFSRRDLEEMRDTMQRLLAESGEGKSHH